jgi:hypothetical protein
MYPLQTLTPGTPAANNDQDAPAPDDEPLIGGRTATHGRVATKGGDEPAGVERERVNPFEPSLARRAALPRSTPDARGERRDQGRASSSMTTARHGRVYAEQRHVGSATARNCTARRTG